jgi:hypothetical protein
VYRVKSHAACDTLLPEPFSKSACRRPPTRTRPYRPEGPSNSRICRRSKMSGQRLANVMVDDPAGRLTEIRYDNSSAPATSLLLYASKRRVTCRWDLAASVPWGNVRIFVNDPANDRPSIKEIAI